MSKTCNNCGNIMDDDANICSRCGTQFIALQGAAPEQAEQPANNSSYPQTQYQQQQQYGAFQQPYGQGYQQPYQPYNASAEKPMSVGSWVGTILLTSMFGVISLILLLIWAFSNDVPLAKKNYCRAMLIVELIAVGLVIILFIIFAGVLGSSNVLDEMLQEIQQFY